MGRVTRLLDAFRHGDGLTLSQLARHTGFPPSSTHRMLGQLVDAGLVRRSETRYHLGTALIELGGLAVAYDRIHRAALPVLFGLRRELGVDVRLTVLDGDSLLCLAAVGRSFDAASRAGERRPACGSADGVAALAHRAGEPREFVATGERIRCVAAAFPAGDGETAALSASAPRERAPRELGRRVRSAADTIAAQLTGAAAGPP
ncbi:MarR family transcriptional regulator [Rhodococcus rhodnii]|uniref:MarR family transcriptional regulator n=1 Tax=Rhodococcus rhodnii TaxID=38312 RepID=A0A6P2CLF9_9NOCA|nr:MarR family transcriptional regulator [Rhodococcus rhodnii]